MNTYSVYWIRCKDHTDMFSQGYIGVSNNAKRRFTEHGRNAKNKHFKFAIQKYGWDNLVKTEILIAEEYYCLDIERKLRPNDGIGWNIVMGGGKPPIAYGHKRAVGNTWNNGVKHSLERKKKRSEINKLRMQNPEFYQSFTKSQIGKSPWNKGKQASFETKQKIRLSHLGVPSKKKGKPISQETLDKLKQALKNNPWTCPHCQKTGLNKGLGNRWHFDNCKLKGMI